MPWRHQTSEQTTRGRRPQHEISDTSDVIRGPRNCSRTICVLQVSRICREGARAIPNRASFESARARRGEVACQASRAPKQPVNDSSPERFGVWTLAVGRSTRDSCADSDEPTKPKGSLREIWYNFCAPPADEGRDQYFWTPRPEKCAVAVTNLLIVWRGNASPTVASHTTRASDVPQIEHILRRRRSHTERITASPNAWCASNLGLVGTRELIMPPISLRAQFT